MPRKIARKLLQLKVAAPKDVHTETEKHTIPQDGEVQLENSGIVADSFVVKELKTEEEFEAADDQSLAKGQFFPFVEEKTLFFSPEDAGRRVEISYKWKEEDSSGEEESEEADASDEEEEDSADDEEKNPVKPKSKLTSDNLWHVDQEWFKWEPSKKKIEVNNSLAAKLGKDVDIRKGVKVFNAKTGKELKVSFVGSDKGTFAGDVAYNYNTGMLRWQNAAAAGNTYNVEYFIKGEKSKPQTMAGEENEEKEFRILEGIRSKAEDIWTNLLDHPDPAFVRDTILPVIEAELEASRDEILKNKSDPKQEKLLAAHPDLTGEFIELEQLLAKREEDNSSENRETARTFIESDVAPKLSKFYSLAALLAEKIYDLQTQEGVDEDFPEFGGSGGRVLDVPTLKYIKRVKQDASKLDQDILDFSKYYTGLIISWIREPETYIPIGSKKKDSRWDTIKRVFENAGIGIADLQVVALDAFRKALLEFDRESRNKEEIPDPKKFRVHGNPFVKQRVTNALKRVFDKYQREQTMESTLRSGSQSIKIPEGGGTVDIGVKGFRMEDLVIKNKSGETFTSSAGKLLPTVPEGRTSKLHKIVLGSRHKDAQVALVDPETGNKLTRIFGPWNKQTKEKIINNPKIYVFNTSSGTFWVGPQYAGKQLLVEDSKFESGTIGKNQYKANSKAGTLEFSPLNGGETVTLTYSQTIRSDRYVNPVLPASEDSGDDEGPASGYVDTVGDEGSTDPSNFEEQRASKEKVEKILELLKKIIVVDTDPRLTSEDRAILKGTLGIGEEGSRQLTIQEIAGGEPFNVDVTDSNKMNQMKKKKQKALNSLVEVLREETLHHPEISKLGPLVEKFIFQDKKPSLVPTDKYLEYLKKHPDGGFKRVLVGLMGTAGLKPAQENVLRWMWAIPGEFRREGGDDHKPSSLPSGVELPSSPGERLSEIAVDEFDVEPSDDGSVPEAATALVRKVYERALDRIDMRLEDILGSENKQFEEFLQSKFPDFLQDYQKYEKAKTLKEELLDADASEVATPTLIPKELAKKKPLFEELKSSIPGVEDAHLKKLMEQLVEADKSGKSLSDLINERQKRLDAFNAEGMKTIDSKLQEAKDRLKELRSAVDETKAAISKAESEVKNSQVTFDELIESLIKESTDKESKTKISLLEEQVRAFAKLLHATKTGAGHNFYKSDFFQHKLSSETKDLLYNFNYVEDMDPEDSEEAISDIREELLDKNNELKALKLKILNLVTSDKRKAIVSAKRQIAEAKGRLTKFKELLPKQEVEADNQKDLLEKKLAPMKARLDQKASESSPAKDLNVLRQVQNFLLDREEYQRGDGSFKLDNMFEVKKEKAGPGYTPPKFAPGEEDTYQPGARPDVGGGRVLPKDPGRADPFTVHIKEPKKKERDDDEMGFTPKEKPLSNQTSLSLYDELRAAALPPDADNPDQAKEDLKKFKLLMQKLREHFSAGKSVKEFKPNLPKSDTLPNQAQVIKKVVKYLLEYGKDLQKSPGVWDLKDMFKANRVKPIDFAPKAVDISTDDSAAETLSNNQPSVSDKSHAKTLHRLIQMLKKGTPLTAIMKGLKASGKNTAHSALGILRRLSLFMAQHPDLQSDDGWDFTTLYNGQHKFPSYEEYENSKPLEEHLTPLVEGIQRTLKEENPEGGVESQASTHERVMDVIGRMSELALQGYDLEQMAEFFEEEDKKGSRPYSLLHLFGIVRNFISKLNDKIGLSNMRNDLGLAQVFGPGAPAGTPVQQDEVTPMSESAKEEILPEDEYTSAFREMARKMKLTDAEMTNALKVLSAIQIRTERGDIPTAEVLGNFLKKVPSSLPLMKKVLTFIGNNKARFKSPIPGYSDFSSLTGMPFRHPDLLDDAPPPEDAGSGTPVLDKITEEPTTPVDRSEAKDLRKSIFNEFVEEHELDQASTDLIADAARALKANPGRSGVEKLMSKAKGTVVEKAYTVLLEFFHEKGLIDAEGVPDFRGVALPAVGERDTFVSSEGEVNVGALAQEAEEIEEEIPDPEIGQEKEEVPSSIKQRLQRQFWKMLVDEFDLDSEDQSNALEILDAIKGEGLTEVRNRISGQGSLEFLLEDIIAYANEKGLASDDLGGVVLPEQEPSTEEAPEIQLDEPEAAAEKAEEAKLPATIRSTVDEATVRTVLTKAKALQDRASSGSFSVFDLVNDLEGVVTPEDVKNALLQGMEDGSLDLEVETDAQSLPTSETRLLPVTEQGVAFSGGKVLKLPEEPKTEVKPEAPADQPAPKKRGRLSTELSNKKIDLETFNKIFEKTELSIDETMALSEAFPSIETMSYRDIVQETKKGNLSEIAKQAILKYLQGLVAYLRSLEKAPAAKEPATREPIKEQPKAEPLKEPEPKAVEPAKQESTPKAWEADPASDKQLSKILDFVKKLQAAGQEIPVQFDPDKLSKGEASKVLNTLYQAVQALPRPTKATGKQIFLIENLYNEVSDLGIEPPTRRDPRSFTEAEAAKVISMLQDLIKKNQEELAAPAPAKGGFSDGAQSLARAFEALDRKGGGYNQVTLHDLRKSLPLSREAFDAALMELRKANLVVIQPWEGRHSNISPEVAEAGIKERGTLFVFVAKRNPEVPLVEEVPAPAPAVPKQPAVDPSVQKKNVEHHLMDKALQWMISKKISNAAAFKAVLRKQRPDLLPVYENILSKVQEALDAVLAEDMGVDLSEI